MINLIKNELIKIFSKKGIWVWGIIILFLTGIDTYFELVDISNKASNEEETIISTKEKLDSFDLSIESQANKYVESKVLVDIYEIKKNYDYESPEYYYIDNTLKGILTSAYEALYVSKDEESYKEYKDNYDNLVNNLDKYNWEDECIKQRNELNSQISALEDALKSDSSNEESINLEISSLKLELDGYNYRLNNNIPLAYTTASNVVENYVYSGTEYLSAPKDESTIEERFDLNEKRNLEESFYKAKYMLDNNVFNDMDSESTTPKNMISLLTGLSGYTLIAIVIIAGGIIADEFNKGTIKQLLIRPYSRTKILFSKIIAAFIAIILFILFDFIIQTISSLIILKDFSSLSLPILVYDFNKRSVVEYSLFTYCIINFLATLPEIIITLLIVIFVGVVSLNSVLSVISCFAITVFLPIISINFVSDNLSWLLPTYCWEFYNLLFGNISSNPYVTFTKCAIECFIIIVVLTLGSVIVFKKRDIKNQ